MPRARPRLRCGKRRTFRSAVGRGVGLSSRAWNGDVPECPEAGDRTGRGAHVRASDTGCVEPPRRARPSSAREWLRRRVRGRPRSWRTRRARIPVDDDRGDLPGLSRTTQAERCARCGVVSPRVVREVSKLLPLRSVQHLPASALVARAPRHACSAGTSRSLRRRGQGLRQASQHQRCAPGVGHAVRVAQHRHDGPVRRGSCHAPDTLA